MILTSAYLCIALNLYFESRGEPDLGMKLVAQATLNRAKHDKSKVCDAVLAANQFSWTKSKVQNKQLIPQYQPAEIDKWKQSQNISKLALQGKLKLDGDWNKVTHFHNLSVSPQWSTSPRMVKVGRVGNHVFYYEIK